MQKWIKTTFSTSLLAMGISSGAVMAQQNPPAGTAQAPMTAPAPNFSDAQLEKFVSASKKVAMISQEYTPELQASPDDASRKKVYKKADEKMVKAVHDEGMTVDQFNGINQALQQNPQLVQRVQEIAK